MISDDQLANLMHLLDQSVWGTELPQIEEAPTDFDMRVQANMERIGDALCAIALLMARRDEEVWEAWEKW